MDICAPYAPTCFPSLPPSYIHVHTQQVLGVGGGDAQRVSYAILQPITSLRATLTHIRPTKSAKLQELLRRVGRPPYSATAPARLGCHGDVGGGVVSVTASELEIHANLSLLFPRQPRPTGLTEGEMRCTKVIVTGI